MAHLKIFRILHLINVNNKCPIYSKGNCINHLILAVASVVDIQLADCFAAVVAYLDAVEPLTSAESLVLQ